MWVWVGICDLVSFFYNRCWCVCVCWCGCEFVGECVVSHLFIVCFCVPEKRQIQDQTPQP